MKKLLLSLLLTTVAAPSLAPASELHRDRSHAQKHCNCYELERRIQGLQIVSSRLRLDRYEEQQIRRDLQGARWFYHQVNFRTTPAGEQSRVCSLGNQAANRSWVQWQPWLARRGWDPGNVCGAFFGEPESL